VNIAPLISEPPQCRHTVALLYSLTTSLILSADGAGTNWLLGCGLYSSTLAHIGMYFSDIVFLLVLLVGLCFSLYLRTLYHTIGTSVKRFRLEMWPIFSNLWY